MDRRLDAVWPCKVAERQMLRPSFVPPPQIRQLRPDSLPVELRGDRTREITRLELLLEWSRPASADTPPGSAEARRDGPGGPTEQVPEEFRQRAGQLVLDSRHQNHPATVGAGNGDVRR